MSCPFCRIVRSELPCRKVWEDESTLVFLDIAGDADGHLLAIPKKHVQSLLDCDPETLRALTETVRRVSQHLTERCGYAGVNLLHASGVCAGQSVPHLHLHLLPRRPDDGIDAWPTLPGAQEDPDAVWERLRIREDG